MAPAYYFGMEFGKAAALFEDILKVNPEDHPARLFHKKAGTYITKGVPDGWTGVERMERK